MVKGRGVERRDRGAAESVIRNVIKNAEKAGEKTGICQYNGLQVCLKT